MAASSLSLVNQKLAYCRALMRMVQQDSEAEGVDNRFLRQGLLEGAAFHLLCAYRHYLRELAENYEAPDSSYIGTEDDLLEVLNRQGRDPAEARELKHLRTDPESWLSELQASYHACWQKSDRSKGKRIQVLDLDAPEPAVTVVSWEALQRWYSAFNTLIERQRDSSAEW